MKTLSIHFVEDHGEGRIEMAGRCTCEAISVGDVLHIERHASILLRVVSMEVYGKQVELLPPAYVGNLFFKMISELEPDEIGWLGRSG